MQSTRQPDELDLRDLLSSLWHNAWLVGLVVALGVALALAHSALQATLFTSHARVRVFNPNSTAAFSSQAQVDPVREVQLQTLYAQSKAVADAADKRLGPDARRVGSVTIIGDPLANDLDIAVSSPSRAVAQKAAQAYADSYVDARRAEIARVLNPQADKFRQDAAAAHDRSMAVQQQLAQMTPRPATDAKGRTYIPPEPPQAVELHSQVTALDAQEADLTKSAQQVDFESAVRQADIAVVSPADRPDAPAQPTPARDTAVAGSLGLLVGIALAIARGHTDDRIREPADLRELFGREGTGSSDVPVVAIPWDPAYEQPASPDPSRGGGAPPAREAFGNLRAMLVHGPPEKRARSVLVASADHGEGRTTTAANLAVAMAAGGRRVLLVDGDLRWPKIHEIFGLTNAMGLTSVLAGRLPLADAVRTPKGHGVERLQVLTAGPLLGDPAEQLLSPGLPATVSQMLDRYHLVVLDSPPVLGVSDALTIASHVEGVVLVVRAGKTRVRKVEEVLAQLHSFPGVPLAAVLNGTRGRPADRHHEDRDAGAEAPSGRREGNVLLPAGRTADH